MVVVREMNIAMPKTWTFKCLKATSFVEWFCMRGIFLAPVSCRMSVVVNVPPRIVVFFVCHAFVGLGHVHDSVPGNMMGFCLRYRVP